MMETRTSLLLRVRDPANSQGWGEFVELYEPLLLAYARKRGLAEHDARDVVQDIFASLIRALPGFELDRQRGRFRTWLWHVTRNAVADWGRRRGRLAAAEREAGQQAADGADDPGEEEEAEWLADHRRRVLHFVLERLQAKTKETTWQCFQLHILEGRPGAEVATELGLSANSVYVNASRVLGRVRQQCADYAEDLSAC